MRVINRCPHVRIRGIFGDEINHTPGYRRLVCMDCGRLLDGPVRYATHQYDPFGRLVTR